MAIEAVETEGQLPRYTARCSHCARTVFSDARRIADIQLTMIASHVLICQPLASVTTTTELLAHCKVTERVLQ